MPKKVIVLGTGLVGRAIAIDLAGEYNVTVVDLSTEAVSRLKDKGISTIQVDLSIPGKVRDQVSGFDLAVGALPGHLGYNAIGEIIEAGINLVNSTTQQAKHLVAFTIIFWLTKCFIIQNDHGISTNDHSIGYFNPHCALI